MAFTTDTDCVSQTTGKRPKNLSESQGKAGELPQKSKPRSKGGRGKGATNPVGSMLIGSEIGLSILQAGFDQALEEGLIAKLGHINPVLEITQHRIVIEIWGAAICGSCLAWTTQQTCPACGSQIG